MNTTIDQETKQAIEEVQNEHGPVHRTNEKVSLDGAMANTAEGEVHAFDAQMDSLLSILINSVYSSKDYFLRELISNASDANDKRKRLMYTEQSSNDEELCIRIISDKMNKTITITDTGIGMSKADLVKYLGSIASSGTKEFRKKIQEEGSKGSALDALIGQFGLGFYSAFLVADEVDVISRKGTDAPYIWRSRGPGGFIIAPYEGDHPQGTSVILKIADQCKKYLEEKTIENIIKLHSSFIAYPIYLLKTVEKKRPAPKKDGEEKEKAPEDEDKVEDAEEEKEEKEETYYEEEFTKLNTQTPLWARNPKEETITEEEYEEFYKAFTNDWEKHFAVSHSFIESGFNLQILLFLQNRQPFNMFEKGKKNPCNIKLYVQNVLVGNDLSEAVPDWMGFVHGVISSNDIPINVSREIVQGKSVMNLLKRVVFKKVLDLLKDLTKDSENYLKFYENCGSSLKIGVYQESAEVGAKLAKLLRYKTSKSDKPISFDEYISRKPEGQKQIYIVTGMSEKEVLSSPALVKMAKYEVIYMPDPMDEFLVQSLSQYENIPFQRITSEGLELPEETISVEAYEAEYKKVLEEIKTVLGEKIDKVILSPTLGAMPCCISSGKYSYSPAMEKIVKAQPKSGNNAFFSSGFLSKKIFEINPTHSIMEGLKRLTGEEDKEQFKQTVSLIFDSSMLASGYAMEDITEYSNRVFNYIQMGLNK